MRLRETTCTHSLNIKVPIAKVFFIWEFKNEEEKPHNDSIITWILE